MNMSILHPVERETVSAKQFLEIAKRSNNIESVHFVSPRIGDGTFGRFEIKYKSPVIRNSKNVKTR